MKERMLAFWLGEWPVWIVMLLSLACVALSTFFASAESSVVK